MNTNLSFFLIFSFCSYFVNSVDDDLAKYASLFKIDNNEIYNKTEEKFYNIICSLDPNPEQFKQRLLRAASCKLAIQRLRKKNEDGYEDFYMDYHRFLEKPDCDYVEVSIPTKNITANQPVVLCPLRPSFIPMNTNYELIRDSNFIAAFPEKKTNLMIFNPILNPDGKIESWKLLKIINKINWHRYNIKNLFHKQLFQVPVPKNYSKTQDIFNLLSNSTEHLSKMSTDRNHIMNLGFNSQICRIVYRPGIYKEFIYDSTCYYKYMKSEVEKVTLFSEEPGKYVEFFTRVRTCCRKLQTTPTTYMDDYRITAGPLNNSFILLRKTDDVLKVIELILDLSVKYIDLYDQY